MSGSAFFREGKLVEAIDAQTQAVKAAPTDPNQRLFLFTLLAFSGNLDRARRQIEAVKYDDLGRDNGAMLYRLLLDAEEARRRLFRDGVPPHFLAEPPAHVVRRLEGVRLLSANQQAQSALLLREASAAAPSVAGECNGKPFTSLCDTDELFGPVLEVMVRDKYCWVPVEQVRSVRAEGPNFPRDLIWLPAQLALQDGQASDVFLPVLYPASHEQADDRVKLGRVTRWDGPEEGPIRGLGARVFEVGEDEVCLLDFRQLTVRPSPAL
jgi:type VI secretion system protein ImpE